MNDMTEPVQVLDINMLHNVHVVEELIQLIGGSNANIIANSHCTVRLSSRILSRLLHQCIIVSMLL